jgi:release factor glutamine methyltransferase
VTDEMRRVATVFARGQSPDIRSVRARASTRLEAVGCDTPSVDGELLLAQVLGTTRSGLRANYRRTLSAEEIASFERMVVRREAREPVAYILGEWGFRRLVLRVDARALVPRPETETVVERCLELVRGRAEPRLLDVGTGSGAIALALADEHAGARVTGIDESEAALELARENVKGTRLDIELVRWDLFAGLPAGPWDLVVSNPPYVRPGEVNALEPEVREWEPRRALVGEGATEAIAGSAKGVLADRGALVLETADGDATRVAELVRDLGYRNVRISRDLAGRERVVEGMR